MIGGVMLGRTVMMGVMRLMGWVGVEGMSHGYISLYYKALKG